MHVQAITTKFYGPTNTRGSRIIARASSGRVTWEYDHALNTDQNHDRAAQKLANKFGWGGRWYSGGAPDHSGNVYVCAKPDEAAFTTEVQL